MLVRAIMWQTLDYFATAPTKMEKNSIASIRRSEQGNRLLELALLRCYSALSVSAAPWNFLPLCPTVPSTIRLAAAAAAADSLADECNRQAKCNSSADWHSSEPCRRYIASCRLSRCSIVTSTTAQPAATDCAKLSQPSSPAQADAEDRTEQTTIIHQTERLMRLAVEASAFSAGVQARSLQARSMSVELAQLSQSATAVQSLDQSRSADRPTACERCCQRRRSNGCSNLLESHRACCSFRDAVLIPTAPHSIHLHRSTAQRPPHRADLSAQHIAAAWSVSVALVASSLECDHLAHSILLCCSARNSASAVSRMRRIGSWQRYPCCPKWCVRHSPSCCCAARN